MRFRVRGWLELCIDACISALLGKLEGYPPASIRSGVTSDAHVFGYLKVFDAEHFNYLRQNYKHVAPKCTSRCSASTTFLV